MSEPLLSATVVIPTLNEEKYLPHLLESLKKIPTPLEIIVVDGNSEDTTARIVENLQPSFTGSLSLRLIRSPKRNISFQRNLGAAHAKHDILIFSDADIVIPSVEGYFQLLQKFTEKKYVAAAPRLVPVESGLQYKYFYFNFYIIQKFLLLFNRPYFAGSYLVTTKDTFFKIGGFDVNVLLGEDVDYSLRAAKVGPCKLINIPYPVSARRIIKYGYRWIFTEIPNLFRFAFTGRVIPDTIFYPFGEFGGKAAHHVTKNKGTIGS